MKRGPCCDDLKLSPVVRELAWTPNLFILNRCKAPEEREL